MWSSAPSASFFSFCRPTRPIPHPPILLFNCRSIFNRIIVASTLSKVGWLLRLMRCKSADPCALVVVRFVFSFCLLVPTHPITHPPFCYLIVIACLIGLFCWLLLSSVVLSCQEIGELVPLAKGEGQIRPRRKPGLLCRPPRISCHCPNPRLSPSPWGNHLLKTSLCSPYRTQVPPKKTPNTFNNPPAGERN